MDWEIISPYRGSHGECNAAYVYHLLTEDFAREYIFGNIKEAQEFCNAAKNLNEFMVNVPKGTEELYHQQFLERTTKNKA
jgi:hypothetical protein